MTGAHGKGAAGGIAGLTLRIRTAGKHRWLEVASAPSGRHGQGSSLEGNEVASVAAPSALRLLTGKARAFDRPCPNAEA